MNPHLGIVAVASPCSQPWEQMLGDHRVRHCRACDKNVYFLDRLTTEEVRALVIAKEGKLCWRFFVRKDGTVLTRDCPVGIRRARQRVVAALALCAAVALSGVAHLLNQCGWFTAAKATGCWSAQLKEAAVVPAPLIAPNAAPGEYHTGKRMTDFGNNNAY